MSQGPIHHHHGTGRLNMPFVGIPSFLRAAICTNLGELDADIAVMGVPTDEGSPFMPGSRFGPRAIREHSMRFVTEIRRPRSTAGDYILLRAEMPSVIGISACPQDITLTCGQHPTDLLVQVLR